MERQKPKNDTKRDNPFSFRNFLTSGTVENSNNRINSDVSHHLENDNRHNRSPNPYSFARFIQNNERRPTNTIRGDNCILVQSELPDFVQDHVSNNGVPDDLSAHYSDLPDFTLYTSENNDHLESNQSHGNSQFAVSNSPSNEEFNVHSSLRNPLLNSTNLPDFLSGTGLNLPDTISDITTNNIRNDEVHQQNGLTNSAEDLTLMTRINELETQLKRKDDRILLLEKQIADQKKKEKEETELMEGVMREVDENLKRAVERWHIAESEVERLKLHIRYLEQKIMQISTKDNNGHVPMHLVRDLSLKLGSDLVVADSILKQLLEHSDKMKVVVGHLQYLDRIEDINGDPNHNNNNHTHQNPQTSSFNISEETVEKE